MKQDRHGNPLSSGTADSIAALDSAVAQLNAFRGDPVRTVAQALKAEPDFVMAHVFLAAIFATAMDKTLLPNALRALKAAEDLATQATDRERAHIGAIRRWVDGDIAGATEAWGRVAMQHPRDILAIQMAQQGDFFQGQSLMLRDRIARVIGAWTPDVPGHGFVHGMYAFGLEEAGEYRAAEKHGRLAMEVNPEDAWAAHAVAHVLEMEARTLEGIAWIDDTSGGWNETGLLAYHLWWHLGLMWLEQGNPAEVLAVYDRNIGSVLDQALSAVDGSALLWRLWMLGHDVGERWGPVATQWATRVEHGINAFNDVHAAMAFAATGRERELDAQIATLERSAAGTGTNALMAREVGVGAARGLQAFGRGRYGDALDHLIGVMPRAALFGGSHAQRDILSWTALEAAIRAGDKGAAQALAAERLARKPESPVNAAWRRRAAALA
ncbi:MAG: tetratricopeptide repeat protein [Alphaproteobacteria bacterium]|nr:tetratricopeptide repeat protein [Alphaproteobacteria bacterium]